MSSILASTNPPLLEVDRLEVDFDTRHGQLRAIDGVSFHIARGEVLGMVGESGAGKSLLGSSLIGLMPASSHITGGQIRLGGQEIQGLKGEAMRAVRGRRIATIFQDPLTSLNPLYTVGEQLTETISTTLVLPREKAEARAKQWLARVGLPDPETRFGSYPHEFSGGMRQRVVIALALCTEPELVVADEPTTALDVSVQAQIIELLRALVKEEHTAMLLITHDIGVIAEVTDRLAVLYMGRIVEMGATATVLNAPTHPYTRGLMQSVPRLGARRAMRLRQMDGAMPRLSTAPWQACAFRPRCPVAIERCAGEAPPLERVGDSVAACYRAGEQSPPDIDAPATAPTSVAAPQATQTNGSATSVHEAPLLVVENLTCHFDMTPPFLERVLEGRERSIVRAVDGVSFYVRRGHTFALVGESGCGKSTIARAVTGLVPPTDGRIAFGDSTLVPFTGAPEQKNGLRNVQMVFQDPYSSLDPRWNVRDIIAEPMVARGARKRDSGVDERIGALLSQVGLSPEVAQRYPHAFSGGQRQRISIARALAGEPTLLVCDEPTSALDVSVQAQILNLMKDLQRERQLTMLFISHDLAVVNFVADVVGVMYLGRLCEIAAPDTLFTRPLHPYTRMLRDAIPDLRAIGGKQRSVQGELPSPLNPPAGCRFHTRCPFANARCKAEVPAMRSYEGAWAACHALEEERIEIGASQGIAALPKPMPEAGEVAPPKVPARRWPARALRMR